ncbi:unnamed protein product [Auanema sp. JU1783]|nr:unnamed protein product [Auanema sp. JU1783]
MFGADKQSYSFADFLVQHKSQLEAGGIPPEQWGALHQKLKEEVFDAGQFFEIVCEQQEDATRAWSVIALQDMDPVDDDCVFLIDHAWTFKPHEARRQLEAMPELVERMRNILDLNEEEEENNDEGSDDEVTSEKAELDKLEQAKENAKAAGVNIPRHESVDARLCYTVKTNTPVIDKILKKIWEYANTYTIRFKANIDEDSLPQWYVMDEFGSRIGHSDEPNVRVVPLFYAPQRLAYNILFFTKSVNANEVVSRDYCDSNLSKKNPDWRNMLYLPWDSTYIAPSVSKRTELDTDFFSSGRNPDKLPSSEEQALTKGARTLGDSVKIYAEDDQLIRNLKETKYELVDDWRKADVIWMFKHFHDFDVLCQENPRGLINQFPYESCLTVKDLMSAIVMQMNNGSGPAWFQPSYNLNNELPAFVNLFQEREKNNQSNTWIIKPWNLARAMDMHVTDNLSQIIRLIESGPKLACKYIERPVLFRRPDNGNNVKFDLRYIIFVKDLEKIDAYIYRNFWIRFSINEFNLDQLDDTETHFTVFNYVGDGNKILQMRCEDFIKQFSELYPNLQWEDIQNKINSSIRELLETVTSRKPPVGVAPNAQSRAMFGIDVMLQWKGEGNLDIQPTILECNFMPDCSRACNYYPDFADTMLNTLFLNHNDDEKISAL